jgi:hypothetical protein
MEELLASDMGIEQQQPMLSTRLKNLKPKALIKFKKQQTKQSDNESMMNSTRSRFASNEDGKSFNEKENMYKPSPLLTATTKFEKMTNRNFIIAPAGPRIDETMLDSDFESALPIGSALPNIDPEKMQTRIETTAKKEKKMSKVVSSPLTASNFRENKFKAFKDKRRSMNTTHLTEISDENA